MRHKSKAFKRSRYESRVKRHRAKAAARHKAWQKAHHRGGDVTGRMAQREPMFELFKSWALGRAA